MDLRTWCAQPRLGHLPGAEFGVCICGCLLSWACVPPDGATRTLFARKLRPSFGASTAHSAMKTVRNVFGGRITEPEEVDVLRWSIAAKPNQQEGRALENEPVRNSELDSR